MVNSTGARSTGFCGLQNPTFLNWQGPVQMPTISKEDASFLTRRGSETSLENNDVDIRSRSEPAAPISPTSLFLALNHPYQVFENMASKSDKKCLTPRFWMGPTYSSSAIIRGHVAVTE